jgi:hypothetical protein
MFLIAIFSKLLWTSSCSPPFPFNYPHIFLQNKQPIRLSFNATSKSTCLFQKPHVPRPTGRLILPLPPSRSGRKLGVDFSRRKKGKKLSSQTTRALFGVIQSRMRGRAHSQFGHPRRASSRPHAGGLLRNGRKVIPSGRTPALLLLHSGSFIEFSVGRRLRGMATGMRLGPVVSKADELEDFCRKPEGVKVVFRC